MRVIVITTKDEVPAYPPIIGAEKENVKIWDYVEKKMEKVVRWVANVPDIYALSNTLRQEIIVIPKYEGETYQKIEIYNGYRE